MLLTDFYTRNSLEQTAKQQYIAWVTLNEDHAIFKGHFPDNPVTPGVCMMQIIKEFTEDIVGKPLQMVKASNVKFMALINPEVNPELRLEISISSPEDSLYTVKNVTYFEDTVALKLVSTYRVK